MVDWMHNLLIPAIKVVFIGGILIFISYYVIKAFHNAWTKQTKFFFKYKIFRKQYPEKTVKWCMNCIERGVGYYDAKKFLMIKMVDKKEINETMYIFDQILISLHIKKKVQKTKKEVEQWQKISEM